MIDQWNEKLECPVCGATGMASLSQESHETTPIVLTVPHGFMVVMKRDGPDFQCVNCGVFAKP